MTYVSVIIPCYNEEKRISSLLEAIYNQTHPRDQLEVIIADGFSSDLTRKEIVSFQSAHPELKITLVDNPKRIIPAGLNLALSQARGEIVIRLDGHSKPHPDYIEWCVRTLESGKGDNVGGIWEIEPGGDGWIARAISAAAAHPLGVGDALYRYADSAAEVDTVPFGCFRRKLLNELGGYDETLLANEDYELNARIRQRGGKVWLDPRIRSKYYARSSLQALAKQYWRYGFWKLRMLQRYARTIRLRQLLPPLFVLCLLTLAVLAIFWELARLVFLLLFAAYFSTILIGALPTALRRKEIPSILGMPLAIAVMHISWGSGFLWSLFTCKRKREA